jgi:hypothetical protein
VTGHRPAPTRDERLRHFTRPVRERLTDVRTSQEPPPFHEGSKARDDGPQRGRKNQPGAHRTSASTCSPSRLAVPLRPPSGISPTAPLGGCPSEPGSDPVGPGPSGADPADPARPPASPGRVGPGLAPPPAMSGLTRSIGQWRSRPFPPLPGLPRQGT